MPLREQIAIAREIELRVLQRRLVLGSLAFGLGQLDLEGTRIDLREQIALLNDLPLLERDVDQLAVDAASDRHGVQRGRGPEPGQVDAHLAAPRGSGHDRHRPCGPGPGDAVAVLA